MILLAASAEANAQVTLTQATNFAVDVAADGRLAMDLLGSIWTLQPDGGQAIAVTEPDVFARRPRWSPDGNAIVYQRRGESNDQLWFYSLIDESTTNISDGQFFDQHPNWHPDGERIAYSSDRRDSGFDLWELDLETRLTWRISDTAGDETEPSWSTDGRDLAYIHFRQGQWSLMLREHGRPDRALVTSAARLSSPSWRPDGSLLTFLRHGEDGLSTDMVILSDPLLVRPLLTGEDFFIAPVAWRDRQNFLYTASGVIRTRPFNAWTSKTLPFRAMVRRIKSREVVPPPERRLPVIGQADTRLVIRASRLFDGIGVGYRENLDIVIDDGRIVALEPQRDRPGVIVVDLGNVTALPGYVDSYAFLPADTDDSLGPVLLSLGVTTIVAAHPEAERLNRLWSGKELPGPRVLGDDWSVKLELLSSMVLGTDSLPISPAGISYENGRITEGDKPASLLSGLADARTPGLESLLRVRQARLLGDYAPAIRRFNETPDLGPRSPPIVLGSKPNGLPPGIAVHAEFRALSEADLTNEQVLRSAGINAANALGLGLQLGRIAPGAGADLVFVDGDPLADITATQNVVGIVRNGRFFSAIGLIERAETARNVE